MGDSAARLLALLSLLQAPRDWPGSELARRLEVSGRTIRRDVERLRGLGYPVEATAGAVGGYRLVGGTAMPPLLLDDEEAVAIAVGLRTVVAHAVGSEEASIRALAKLQQVLPPRLRSRVGALSSAIGSFAWEAPTVEPEALTLLARAVANRERIRFDYAAVDGTESRRLVEPHGLVAAGRRWYLVAWDTDRGDWRTFRIDRVRDWRPVPGRVVRRELPAPDPASFVASQLESLAPTYEAVATVRMAAVDVRSRLAGAAAAIEPIDDASSRLRLHADTIEWLADRLIHLGVAFEVHEPPELAAYIAALAARLS